MTILQWDYEPITETWLVEHVAGEELDPDTELRAVTVRVDGETVLYGIGVGLAHAVTLADEAFDKHPRASSWGSRRIELGQPFHI